MLSIHHSPPAFTERDTELIALAVYGMQVEARPLPGEHDRNFMLEAGDGQRFVLKIARAGEQWETLDLQNQALAHLAQQASDLHIPRLLPTCAGQAITTLKGNGESMHLARLLSYLPGRPLAQAKPHTPALLHHLGTMLGTLDKALLNFTHPAAQRELKWDVSRASWIGDYLHYIASPQRRELIERLLTRFESDTLPRMPALRQGVIHNDANDYNVLVDYTGPNHRPVLSLLDFGDMLHAPTMSLSGLHAAA